MRDIGRTATGDRDGTATGDRYEARWLGLGPRLALAAVAAFIVAVPFTVLLLLVKATWAPLDRLDVSATARAAAWVGSHDASRTTLEVIAVVFSPEAFRLVGLAVTGWLLVRGSRRLALWVVTTLAVGGLLGVVLKLVVARARPVIEEPFAHSSGYAFPSGHALNSVVGVGVLLFVFLPLLGRRTRAAAWAGGGLVVLITGVDRVGLGVHYVSDVVGGWLVGLACLAATLAAFQSWRGRLARRPVAAPSWDGRSRRGAVVVNPLRVPEGARLRERVERAMREHGWEPPVWLETTRAEPGRGLAARAAADGADLVLACGGDGTVMSCISGVAGTGVPLALLPAGTGNLLARNLDLPVDDVEAAVRVALTGADRAIDVGACGPYRFAVMAGLGFDAAMMRDAPERLKSRVGWPAYVVSGLRHVRGQRTEMTLTLDGGRPFTRRARTVVVGNVGRLQGGIPLLPDALPDDGVLDVVLIAPRNLFGWLRVVVAVLGRRRRPELPVERYRCRTVRIEAEHPLPQQLDGEVIGESDTMEVAVQPRALIVRVPDRARRPDVSAPQP